jgi:putative tricarboxylic transport membrane protein
MAKYDRISTIFFVGFALAICVESIRIGPGSLSNPGPGLIPLGCGLVLGILSLIVLCRTFKKSQDERAILWEPGTRWAKIFLTIFSIFCYAFLIEFLGFQIITFVWMVFVCRWIGGMRWKTTLITSVITTSSCYLIFEYLLMLRFPKGILGF